MKKVLIKIFWPILNIFESNVDSSHYKKSHRVALIVMGALFLLLAIGSAAAARSYGGLASMIPVVIFFCVGFISVVVGSLGSNGAVSKIWGTK